MPWSPAPPVSTPIAMSGDCRSIVLINRARLAVESERRVGVPDARDRGAHDVRHGHVRRRRDLAGNAGETRRHQGLAGDPRFGIVGENGVEDGVGDGIRDLVGMAFGDGFRRKEMAIVHGIGIRGKGCDGRRDLD